MWNFISLPRIPRVPLIGQQVPLVLSSLTQPSCTKASGFWTGIRKLYKETMTTSSGRCTSFNALEFLYFWASSAISVLYLHIFRIKVLINIFNSKFGKKIHLMRFTYNPFQPYVAQKRKHSHCFHCPLKADVPGIRPSNFTYIPFYNRERTNIIQDHTKSCGYQLLLDVLEAELMVLDSGHFLRQLNSADIGWTIWHCQISPFIVLLVWLLLTPRCLRHKLPLYPELEKGWHSFHPKTKGSREVPPHLSLQLSGRDR